jgi:phage-related protein
MDTFGLGIVLSFTDNATSGMQSATSALSQLKGTAEAVSSGMGNTASTFAAAGQSAMTLGNSLVSAGSKVTGLFSSLISSVSTMGNTLENARITLGQFFGGAEEGEKMLDWIMDFGARSPFESMDLIGISTSFKAAGVDVRDSITMMNGGTQELMASLGDLMALHPEVSMSRWKLAFSNSLSGADKVLQNILDVGDLGEILGHEFGEGEQAINSLVELTQKLNVEGLMTKMYGTWGQTVSNMSDVWDKFLKGIVDVEGGAFDKLKEALMNISGTLAGIDDEKMKSLSAAISGGLNIIINPLVKISSLAAKFIGWITTLAATHPNIAKLVIGFAGLAAGALVAAGMFLKFSGSLFFAMSALKGMSSVGGISSMLHTIGLGFSSLMAAILPFIAIASILALVWTKNIGSIRDKITKFVTSVKDAFNRATYAADNSMSKFSYIVGLMQDLSNKGNWFQGLSLSILKIIVLIKGVVDAWNDDELDLENFQKADELGIMPLIESILMFRDKMSEFAKGFTMGLDTVFSYIDRFKAKLGFFKASDDIQPVFDVITGFLDKINTGNFEKFGETIGKIAGAIVLLFPVFNIVKTAFGFLSGPIGIIVSLLSLFMIAWKNDFGGIQDIVQSVITVISQKFDELTQWLQEIDWDSILSNVQYVIGGIVQWFQSVDWGVVWDNITSGFQLAWDTIKNIALQIWQQIEPIVSEISLLFIDFFNLFKNSGISEQAQTMGVFLIPLFQNIGSIIQSLLPILGIAWGFIKTVIVSIVSNIREHILPIIVQIASRVMNFVNTVVIWISMLVSAVRPIIQNLVSWVRQIWDGWLKNLVENIIGFVVRVGEALGLIALFVYDSIIKPATEVITFLAAILLPIISNVINSIVSIVMNIVDTVGGVINGLMVILNGIIDFLIGVFTGDWERAWTGVKEIFGGIWDIIKSIAQGALNGIINLINGVIGGLNLLKIPDWVPGVGGKGINIPLIPTVQLATGGYVKDQGIAMLHPNEVVINDKLTQGLQSFVQDYSSLPRNVIPVDFSSQRSPTQVSFAASSPVTPIQSH